MGINMQRIYVEEIKQLNDQYIATTADVFNEGVAHLLKDGGRMLVDSDELAFIYVLEDDEKLYYLFFQEHTWNMLKRIRDEEKELSLRLNEKVIIQLKSVCAELDFLTENIDGNGNYGEKMELAVKRVFT